MIYVLLVFLILPVIIIVDIFKTNDKRTKKVRGYASIPSFVVIFLYIALFIANILSNFLKSIDGNWLYIVALLLDFICLIFYISGTDKERVIMIDDAKNEIENVKHKKVGESATVKITTRWH